MPTPPIESAVREKRPRSAREASNSTRKAAGSKGPTQRKRQRTCESSATSTTSGSPSASQQKRNRFISSRRRLGPQVDLSERSWSGEFSFIQLADTQFGLATSIVGAIVSGKLDMDLQPFLKAEVNSVVQASREAKNSSNTKGQTSGDVASDKNVNYDEVLSFLYDRELEFSRRAVAVINAMSPAPKFVVVCGDLVNQYPTVQKGPLGQQRQVKDFKSIFSQVRDDIELLCLCGNREFYLFLVFLLRLKLKLPAI